MIKHRGFPSRLPGTDYQFTIRRASKSKVTNKVSVLLIVMSIILEI